ncbi:MAG: ABC transporter substrate-binding protein [Tepidiformaceae bacterium]
MNRLNQTLPITRRKVLTAGGVAVAGMTAIPLVGCGSSSNDNKTPAGGASPSGSPSAAPAPKKGGTLTASQTGDSSFNTGYPFSGIAENGYIQAIPIEPLIRYADSLKPTLVLVDQYDFSADGKSLTARLLPNLKFHNGQPVTPDDVFFGIELITDPAKFGIKAAFQLAFLAKNVTKMTAVDDRTMQLEFAQSLPNMNDFFAQLPVTQRASFDALKAGKDVQGTGAFKFTSWTPNVSISFARNPEWHGAGAEGLPYLDEIVVKEFADQQSEALTYQAGDIDVILGADPTTAATYKSKGLTSTAPKSGLTYCGMNVTNAALKDPRVRQALFMAVDRERFITDLRNGFGEVTCQPWPKSSPAFDPALDSAHYDPTQAKALLKEAGFTQSAPLPLNSRSPDYDNYAALLKQNFEAVGVNVEIVPMEAGAFTALLQKRGFEALWTTTHAYSDVAPVTNLEVTFPYRIPNISYYDTPAYEAIINTLKTLDPLSAEAKVQYKAFNALFLNDPWLIPMFPAERIDLIGTKVRGFGEYFVTLGESPNFAKIWKDG